MQGSSKAMWVPRCVCLGAAPAERGPDRMPAGARKLLAQSQNTAQADPQGGEEGKSDSILGSLRVRLMLCCLQYARLMSKGMASPCLD